MNFSQPPLASSLPIGQVVEVNWHDRWEVYRRLQELQIPCQCESNQPLRVEFQTPGEALQLWSVVRQFNLPRHEIVRWLGDCWQLETGGYDA